MGESRLSSLALMHIKYDMPVNLEEIVNLFEGLHPRMMQFASFSCCMNRLENLTDRNLHLFFLF